MKTVFGIKNHFWGNLLNFENMAADQAVIRASVFRVLCHSQSPFLSGGYRFSKGQSLVHRLVH